MVNAIAVSSTEYKAFENMEQEMNVTKRDGTTEPRDIRKIQRAVEWMCRGLNVSQSDLETSVHLPMYDGITTADIQRTFIIEAASKISAEEPEWTYVAARGLLQLLYKQANDGRIKYPTLESYLEQGVACERLDPRLLEPEFFDLRALNAAIRPELDLTLDYLGLQTLTDRYFIRDLDDNILELPQFFFMRVAMGVALNERTRATRTEWAIQYYRVYSEKRGLSSTPTLFNSGTRWPQLSSCFGQTYGDATDSIMDGLKESAQYSKFSGGVAVDVGGIRANGSSIRSTNGKAGGPIPYIKLVNGVMIGFDQSGKRKGSCAIYMEPWHADIFKFLDLREPGDDRVRAHDVFPALWIPDLFMERVIAGEQWSLFDPKVVPELHQTYGETFKELYEDAERRGLFVSQLPAAELWDTILSRLFTYGVFWPCFKDTMNYRYAQPEIIHNSNLCTEIALRNDENVTFVCNLASVNVGHDDHLLAPVPGGGFHWNYKLEQSVRTLVRNLDAVISIGFVPNEKGRRFQEQDRAIGLGVMGWADALAKQGIDYESIAHLEYANELMRQISLTAIDESANLAREYEPYPTFKSSTWADGQLPSDSFRHHEALTQFGLQIDLNTPFATEHELRAKVANGMRNSCLLAIAPTATIANILGVSQCTELPWQLGYNKKNLSGTFRVFATTLLNNRHGLPLKTARSVDQLWTVWAAAVRQVWIDQSQSTNIWLQDGLSPEEIGHRIDELYLEAYRKGLKTTYYFYAKAEDSDAIFLTPNTTEPQAAATAEPESKWAVGAVCDINAGPDCEACQ